MNASPRNRSIPVGNPLANALVVIAGALAIGVSLVLGLVAFVVLGSIITVLAGIVGIRLWWFQRKMARRQSQGKPRSTARAEGADVIEGEFKVVSRDMPERDSDRP